MDVNPYSVYGGESSPPQSQYIPTAASHSNTNSYEGYQPVYIDPYQPTSYAPYQGEENSVPCNGSGSGVVSENPDKKEVPGAVNAKRPVKKYTHVTSRLFAPTTASRSRAASVGVSVRNNTDAPPKPSAAPPIAQRRTTITTRQPVTPPTTVPRKEPATAQRPPAKMSRPPSPGVSRPKRAVTPTVSNKAPVTPRATTTRTPVSPRTPISPLSPGSPKSKRPPSVSTSRSKAVPTSPMRASSPKSPRRPSSQSPSASPRVVSMSPLHTSVMLDDMAPETSLHLESPSSNPLVSDRPPLSLTNIDHEEELSRVEVEVTAEVEATRIWEQCLESHVRFLSVEVVIVNTALQNEEKRKRADDLFRKSLVSNDETVKMRSDIKVLRSSDRVVATLRDQLKAMNKFNSLRVAKCRQKEATINVISSTSASLATDSDKLLQKLLDAVIVLEVISDEHTDRHQMADSARVKPFQHMAELMQRDLVCEHNIEERMIDTQDSEERGVELNQSITAQVEMIAATSDQIAAETDVLVEQIEADWLVARKDMLKEKEVIRKEITDLNFQIRRGTNIKSLSQLPHVPNMQVWSEVREMYITLEEEKASLARCLETHNRLLARRENLQISHVNHFERLQRQLDVIGSAKSGLDADRELIQGDVLTIQHRSIEQAAASPPGLKPLPADEEDEARLASTQSDFPKPDAEFADEFLRLLHHKEAALASDEVATVESRPAWRGLRSKPDASDLPPPPRPFRRKLTSTKVAWTRDRLEALCKPTLGRQAYMGAREMEVNERIELQRQFER